MKLLSRRVFVAGALALSCAPFAWTRNAPDFNLPTPDGKRVQISQLRGKFVVVEIMSPT